MCLTYVMLAQRHALVVSCGSAIAVWIVLASIVRQFDWTLIAGLAANLIAFGICIPLLMLWTAPPRARECQTMGAV
jgi:hypothetical protein